MPRSPERRAPPPVVLPIACSLSASEIPARLSQMAALGQEALVDTRVAGRHAELRFAAGAGVRERLEAFVDAERRCCAFLEFELRDGPEAALLRIDAPAGAEGVLAELVGAFEAAHAGAPRRPSANSPGASG